MLILHRTRIVAAAIGTLAANCTAADAEVGVPFTYSINAARVTVPEALRDPSGKTLQRVACANDQACPAFADGKPEVHCIAMVCQPDPVSFILVTDIDLNEQPAILRYGLAITRLRVQRMEFDATAQGLTNSLRPTDLFWGPDSAPTLDSPGVTNLGSVPMLRLDREGTIHGEVTLNLAGASAFADYLMRTSRRFRLFARPRIDLELGGPLPTGAITLQVQMVVQVERNAVR